MRKRIVDAAERKYQHDYQAMYRNTEKGRASKQKYKRRYAVKFPEKIKAARQVLAALKAGRLARQPCRVCLTTENVEAHHDDYSKPFDIKWMCGKHHKDFHSMQRILRLNDLSPHAA